MTERLLKQEQTPLTILLYLTFVYLLSENENRANIFLKNSTILRLKNKLFFSDI